VPKPANADANADANANADAMLSLPEFLAIVCLIGSD
jgi:hypothetical protein